MSDLVRNLFLWFKRRFVTGGRSGPPPIITHAGELFDYSQGDMRRHHPTVLSILEVSANLA
jgi:hypothetical protein